jgi:hypothetical protein
MKHLNSIFAILLFASLLFAGNAGLKAQTTDFNNIVSAIRLGDAKVLGKYFNSTLEVTLPGVDETFSAQQAVFVFEDFFKNQKERTFEMDHTGKSGTTDYMTGDFTVKKGANRTTYDTSIFMKKFGGKYLITQIRFAAD